MVKKTDTWMPLYVGDYLADTSRLSTEAHGAYLLILMDYWRHSAPPDDDEVLTAITKLPPARWTKLRPVLAQFFEISDGKWINKRVEKEKAGAAEITTERSQAGRAGAEARWKKKRQQTDGKGDGKPDGEANGKQDSKRMPYAMANGSQTSRQNDAPSPSPSQISTTTIVPEPAQARGPVTVVGEAPPADKNPFEPSPEARIVVDFYLKRRRELWPTDQKITPTQTLNTQAQQYLDAGATPALICEVIEIVMNEKLGRMESAPRNLHFCRLSMESATANQRGAGRRPSERAGRAPPKQPRPDARHSQADDVRRFDERFGPEPATAEPAEEIPAVPAAPSGPSPEELAAAKARAEAERNTLLGETIDGMAKLRARTPGAAA